MRLRSITKSGRVRAQQKSDNAMNDALEKKTARGMNGQIVEGQTWVIWPTGSGTEPKLVTKVCGECANYGDIEIRGSKLEVVAKPKPKKKK